MTPMKKVALLFCVFGLSVFASDEPDDSDLTHMGRFRLLRGQYATHGWEGGYEESGIFKIDSATGRTWLFESYQEGTNRFQAFTEVYSYSFGTNKDLEKVRAMTSFRQARNALMAEVSLLEYQDKMKRSQAEYEKIVSQIEWLENHPNGLLVPGGREGKLLDPSQMITLKRALTNQLATNLFYLSKTNR
jgi:hypothetical protein